MEITFLGTGSIIPSPKKTGKAMRSYSSIFIKIGNDTLLFDIGAGSLTKLQQQGIDTQIYPSHLFITHYHIDHCQDYLSLVKSRAFNPVTGAIDKRIPLKVYGPKGLKQLSDDLFGKTKLWSYMKNDLKVFDLLTLKEINKGLVEKTKHWKVTCCQVPHYNGIAFRIDSKNKSFVYSGDMAYDENFADFAKDADLAAIECSFPDRKTLKGLHCCPEDVGKLAKRGNFKKTILFHLYPQCEGREKEMIEKIKSIAKTKVQIAHDFLKIKL